MTNYEKYRNKIIDIIGQGDEIALKDGIPYDCDKTRCYECSKNVSEEDCCSEKFLKKWLLEDDGEPSPERIAGQEEAWELAQKIVVYAFDGEIGASKLRDIFNTDLQLEIFRDYTYARAAEKVKAWEDSKEVKVGDVVRSKTDPEDLDDMVVIGKDPLLKDSVEVIYGRFCKRSFLMDKLVKTGRTLPVQDWLRQIGGNDAEKDS